MSNTFVYIANLVYRLIVKCGTESGWPLLPSVTREDPQIRLTWRTDRQSERIQVTSDYFPKWNADKYSIVNTARQLRSNIVTPQVGVKLTDGLSKGTKTK